MRCCQVQFSQQRQLLTAAHRRFHKCCHRSPWQAQRSRPSFACQAASYPEAKLAPSESAAALDDECDTLETHIRTWLDEEWTPMKEHAGLAKKCVQTYKDARMEGKDDLGDILILTSGILASDFDFGPTFTDAFEVSNKLIELLMVRQGEDVCCRSETDKELYDKIESERSADNTGKN